MSITIRQENLYGAEDWKLVYTSFKNAEFQSYDFDTLRQAMIAYLQLNYPEEYSDYIQSSEFVALVDLVAFVGQNLSFRMDLNARENILDTAEKRESVLRIARMLSYKPKRVRPAEGFLQVVSLKTSDQLIDSIGNNISNQILTWGSDPSDLEYERFILAMNAALASTNQFGSPSQKTVNGLTGESYGIYQFDNINVSDSYPISATTDGLNLNFDILPVVLTTTGQLNQSSPNGTTPFSLLYRNDGKGIGSIRTGFFALVKQGTLQNQLFRFDEPRANAVIDITNSSNISEDDFVVQTLDNNGTVIKTWSRVQSHDYENITVNEFGAASKDLFEVIYSDVDVTSIKFGDGVFANAPSGIIRVWYRLAENNFIKVKSNEISNKTVNINYVNGKGETHTLTLTLSLQENLTTGIPAETTDEIKVNAPEAFYSKNRMVTGDDYSGLLPSLNNDVLILKTENRTFSGHSRFVDLQDPSGKSRPLVEIGDDGYFYQDELIENTYVADIAGIRTNKFLEDYIQRRLLDINLLNFYYGKSDINNTGSVDLFSLVDTASESIEWTLAYSDRVSSNGFLKITGGTGAPLRVGFTTAGSLRSFRPGSLVKFTNGTTSYWTSVADVKGDGLGSELANGDYSGLLKSGHGVIELNSPVAEGDQLVAILPPMPSVFDQATTIALTDFINSKIPFALILNHTVPSWSIVDTTVYDINTTDTWTTSDPERQWIINVERTTNGWNINNRAINYVFGSEDLVRFYNINFSATSSINQRNASKDDVAIIGSVGNKLTTQSSYRITGYYNYSDGYTDNSKVKVTPLDLDNDVLPDTPDHFVNLVGESQIGLAEYTEGEFTYYVPVEATDPSAVRIVPGVKDLMFKWFHRTPVTQTLNPSLTNIIDVYVLTKTYYDEFVLWKNKGAKGSQPLTDTSEQLRRNFKDLLSYKMSTDEVVFHPVKFKPLFGMSAESELQAQFKVVKNVKSSKTENEIKSKVLTAIDRFFTPGNFDFGETFYFTELAAYIHSALAEDINSVVIVPVSSSGSFGSLFQIKPNNDELVTSVATVNDIVVIKEITNQNIRKI